MVAGVLELIGIQPYMAVVLSGILFALAMLFMAGSCHAFRYLFQRSTKTCCCQHSGTVESVRRGQRRLNRFHPVFVWGTVVLGAVHIGLAIAVVGFPTSLAQTTLVLGWVLFAAFLGWLGTCYYFRHLVERYVFRSPPFCGAESGTEPQYSGDRWIYRHHRTFLYLILLLIPIHASIPLTGLQWVPFSTGLLPGLMTSGAVLAGILLMEYRTWNDPSTGCCR